jgi:hypothetical protein
MRDKVVLSKPEVISKIRAGKTIISIAQEHGVDRRTIYYRLKEWGIST